MLPLQGIRVLSVALNLPGPLAVARLQQLGATVTKVEPLAGDPLAHARPRWYQELHEGIVVLTLDLKEPAGRQQLAAQLVAADLCITAMRPAALERLGLAWAALHAHQPRLCHVAIIGYPPPAEERPGHDLTFQAWAGLLEPPNLPRTCLADFAGAERVVSTALALLLARERGSAGQFAQVSLASAAAEFAAPLRERLTTPDGVLGGAVAGYNLYRASAGWVAVAALEPHFWKKLTAELGLTTDAPRSRLEQIFLERTASEWESWAAVRGLPLAAVKE